MCLTYESALSTLVPFVTQFCSTKQLFQSYVTKSLKNKKALLQKNFSLKLSEFKRSLRLVIKMLITLPKCQLPSNVLELCLVRFETFSYRNITDKDTMFVAICKAKIIVPAKRPLLQMLCCPPALGKGAVMRSFFSLTTQYSHLGLLTNQFISSY